METTPYSIFYDIDIIKRCHHVARKNKRTKSVVVKFEMNEADNLLQIQQQLREKTYRVGKYRNFRIYETKPRVIQALPYRDCVIQHILCDMVLMPYFERKIIHDNTACIKGRGQHYAVNRMEGFLRRFWHQNRMEGYFLKCDIKKFFPSLSHDVIKELMSSKLADPDVRWLFDMIIDSYQAPKEFLDKHNIPQYESKFIKGVGWRKVKIPRGVPIGNQTSQIIGVYYLNPLDRFVKEVLGVKYYIRYMDDFVLVHHDRAFLENCLVRIREFLFKKLKIYLNDKTQIFPMKNGVKFLGQHFYLNERGQVVIKMAARTTKRFKSKVRFINKYHECLPDDVKRSSIASYKGIFKHSNSRGKAKQISERCNVKIPKGKNCVKDLVMLPLEELD